jgi:hypothetical protein
MPLPDETGFIKFKRWCPFKFEEKKHQQLNGNQRAIDTTLNPP